MQHPVGILLLGALLGAQGTRLTPAGFPSPLGALCWELERSAGTVWAVLASTATFQKFSLSNTPVVSINYVVR